MSRQQELEKLQSLATELGQVTSDLLVISRNQRKVAEAQTDGARLDRELRRRFQERELARRAPAEDVIHARFVRVSILTQNRLWSRVWDTIDGEDKPLKVGDRIRFRPIWHGAIQVDRGGYAEGIVRELGREQLDYHGPWSTARRV